MFCCEKPYFFQRGRNRKMKGNISNFFPGANTPQGFHSFFTYLSFKMKYIYIIKGGPGTGKSTFMKNTGQELLEMGFNIEQHHCASDHTSLDGLVIPALETAFLDGTAPHTVDPEYPGAVAEIINLGQFWNTDLLRQEKHDIIRLNKEIKNCFSKAYHYLKLAQLFDSEIRYLQQQHFKTDIANAKAQTIINNLPERHFKITDGSRHLFASGITPEGLINYYDNITKNCKLKYLITGTSGTGKSILIKKIASATGNLGYKTLNFHCSLNPERIDLLLIPLLNIAIINNTFPHTVSKNSKTDITINMMECINRKENNQNEIKENKELCKKYLNKSIEQLNIEKNIHDKLEKYYVKAMNFKKVELERKKILQNILDNHYKC